MAARARNERWHLQGATPCVPIVGAKGKRGNTPPAPTGKIRSKFEELLDVSGGHGIDSCARETRRRWVSASTSSRDVVQGAVANDTTPAQAVIRILLLSYSGCLCPQLNHEAM